MRWVVVVVAGLFVAGCAGEKPVYQPLGSLQMRERVVEMEKGPKGVVYTVRRDDGKVVAERVSLGELRAQEPVMERLVKTGWAGDNLGNK